ncbi:uncharacterized protein At4g02000-like [Quercus lobata]|uniref:uncharacterized protein At4g02000-like n=1 Tax=Quercus lobata TaxID=97700 RepID=UPI001248C777|nr:uncharacterized protein At4g02000-like [Quercus lobata]
MSQQDELVEALNAETNKIRVSGKSLKLKASEKAVEELYNTGLVGKLLADRSINKNAVKAIILKAWRTSRGVQIVDLRENIFLFKFACEGDKRRIVELGPWNIEGFPLILKQWNQNMVVEDLDFSSLPVWIQVHNLSIEYMSKENAVEIGSLVGEVVDVDFTGDGEVCMCNFLRVKVEVKVDDLLRSGFYLDRSPHSDLWIQFKYERVAEFCYKCGRLGHLKARCLKVSHIDAQIPSKEPYGFGHWMKAGSSGRKTSSNNPSPQHQLNQPSGPTSDSVSTDPTLLIGLSKAQNNSLSWTAYYNEGESSGKIQLSLPSNDKEQKPSAKRKLKEDEGLANNRAIKLSKVGSGLLKVVHQPINYIEGAQQKVSNRNVPTRRKKMKDLARELPCPQAHSDSDEVNSDPSSISHTVSSFISKMVEEASLNMPPPQP